MGIRSSSRVRGSEEDLQPVAIKGKRNRIGTFVVAALLVLTFTAGCAPTVEYRGPESLSRIVETCAELSIAMAAAEFEGAINQTRVVGVSAKQTEADLEEREFAYEVTGTTVLSASEGSAFDWTCELRTSTADAALTARMLSFDEKL
jgi:hypothetical protein